MIREWARARQAPKIHMCESIYIPENVDPSEVTFYLIPIIQKKEEVRE